MNVKNLMETDFEPKLGAVYTPIEVATSVCGLVLENFKNRGGSSLNILEPSVGDGLFIKALDSFEVEYQLTAVDLNPNVIQQLKEEVKGAHRQFIHANYIDYANENRNIKYDLIIGNPPFIKKHDYTAEFKLSLDELCLGVNYDRKDLKNAWAAFVVAAENALEENGILSFIVPYELMNVAYGQELQQSVFSLFSRVDIYIPDEKAFKEIDQDAVLFVAQKQGNHENGVFAHRVTSLSDLQSLSVGKIDVSNKENLSIDLKGFLFDERTIDLLHKIKGKCQTVNDICVTSPGIVTGANDFFIQRKGNVDKYKLSRFSKRILKKGSYLPSSPIFRDEDFNELEVREPCYFIYFKNDDVNSFSPEVKEFLKVGEELGLPKRYKCRHRKVWYEVPLTPVTEGFFFKRSHSFPRLCVNEANVLVTDTAYRISMNDGYSINGLCYSFYNSLTLLFAEVYGRFYGGGVLELTPSEFKKLPIVYKEPSVEEMEDFEVAHIGEKSVQGTLISYGDNWLRESLDLSADEIALLKKSLEIIKKHRLRHGKG